MKIAIVGAGIAGLTCADRLQAQGHEVTLFDKARGPGGRMSTRRVATSAGEASFDHGAPWFTVRDLRFRRAVLAWEDAGLVEQWPAVGEEAWVGVPAMNSVVKNMAGRHNVFFDCTVRGLARRANGWCVLSDVTSMGPYDAAILAIPMEQAMAMVSLHDLALARLGSRRKGLPCWTGLVAFGRRLSTNRDVIRDTGIFAQLVRNCAKPGRSGPESWVLQASHAWSAANLERDKEAVMVDLLREFSAVIGEEFPEILTSQAHRWRYACYSGFSEEAFWNDDLKLGLCGDWLMGGNVEGGWISGKSMADEVQIAAVQQNAFASRSTG